MPLGKKILAIDSESDDDELCYVHTFEQDTELTGNMKLKLWIAAENADDLDIFAVIKKLDRRGNEVHFPDFNHNEKGQVATGWLRASHRELDETKSKIAQPRHTHEHEQKVSPNEIVPIEIEWLPSGTLFKKGESLAVVVKCNEIIKGNSTPLPNMKTHYEHEDTVNKCNHLVYTGGDYDSHLIIPVIE